MSASANQRTVRSDRAARWAGRHGQFGLAVVLLFVTGTLYGLTYSLTGVAISNGVPFTAFVFWMGMGSATVVLIISVGGGRRLPPFKIAHVKAFLVSGLAGFGIPLLTAGYVSEKGVPAGIISMLVALAPILTYVGAVLLRLDRFWWIRFVGFIAGIIGVGMLVVPDSSLPSRELVPWIILALLLPLGYTTTTLATAIMRPPQTESIHFAFGYFFFGSLPVLIVVAVSGDWWWFSGPMGDGDWALIVAIFAQALGIYLFVELIRVMGPVFFSGVNFVVALSGIGWGVAFFGESHSIWVWGALAFLMAGVLFVIQRREPAQTSVKPDQQEA